MQLVLLVDQKLLLGLLGVIGQIMIDSRVLPIVEFCLSPVAGYLTHLKVTANSVTVIGFIIGISSLPLIIFGFFKLALLLIIFNRLLDGLDGIIARRNGISDMGAFLDITLDFIFYASIPLAFALHNPLENSLFACILLFTFFGTGSTFLAFSIFAERRKISSSLFSSKGFYYLSGLIEGTETIIFITLMCIFPSSFPILALIFSFLCFISTGIRLKIVWDILA